MSYNENENQSIHLFFFNFSVICYYIKAKEEIQKRTWIREIQKHKQLPGRN